MESAKAEAVAGEGKAVTSERFRYEVKAAARCNVKKRRSKKTIFVERGGSPIGHCKPDPGGKSPGSFNGESGDEVIRPQSL
jgi:hypothetical protein